MAGAYLEINPQDTYIFQSNVLLNSAAVELYQYAIWFIAQANPSGVDGSNADIWINASTLNGKVAISNNGTLVNSVINVTLASNYTANLPYVNSALWSLVIKSPANVVTTVDRGSLAITPRVSTIYV